MNKTVIRVIFYALVVGVTFGAAQLYFHSTRGTAPAPAPSTVADDAALPENTGAPAKNSNAPAATPPKPSKPTCVITIDGQRYDVQTLRSTHEGGDVFVCNTDMSNVFHGQHGDNLRMIQKYLIK